MNNLSNAWPFIALCLSTLCYCLGQVQEGPACHKGQRVLAFFRGDVGGEPCILQRRACWFGAVVTKVKATAVRVKWDSAELRKKKGKFEEVPVKSAAVLISGDENHAMVHWFACDGSASPWPPDSDQETIIPSVTAATEASTKSRGSSKNDTVAALFHQSWASAIFNPQWTESPDVLARMKKAISKGRVVVIHNALRDDVAKLAYKDAQDDWEQRNGSFIPKPQRSIGLVTDDDFFSEEGTLRSNVCNYLQEKFGGGRAYADSINRQPVEYTSALIQQIFDAFRDPGFLKLTESLLGKSLMQEGSCAHDPDAPKDDPTLAGTKWKRPRSRLLTGMLTKYDAGDFISPHNDCVGRRLLSINLHLASPEWKSSWGGGLVWCNPQVHLPAAFNQLVLFAPGADSFHSVETVRAGVVPHGLSRFSLTGWWETDDAHQQKIGGCDDGRQHPWCRWGPWCFCNRRAAAVGTKGDLLVHVGKPQEKTGRSDL